MNGIQTILPAGYLTRSRELSIHKHTLTNRQKIAINVLMIAVVMTGAILIFINRDSVVQWGTLGYFGIFLISLVSCATIVLPMPGMLLLFSFGVVFNPFGVGLAAAVGGTLGEMAGYALGRNGRSLVPGRKFLVIAERLMKKWGMIAVFLFSLIPLLPIDIIGIVAGGLRFPLWKFNVACFFGKFLLYTGMALLGGWGFESFSEIFGV